MDIRELEPKLNDASELLELLSQPTRLKILCTLHSGERSVLALAELIGLSQPAMSHHLAKLRHANIVETRRDAQTIYYSLKGEKVKRILSLMHELFCVE